MLYRERNHLIVCKQRARKFKVEGNAQFVVFYSFYFCRSVDTRYKVYVTSSFLGNIRGKVVDAVKWYCGREGFAGIITCGSPIEEVGVLWVIGLDDTYQDAVLYFQGGAFLRNHLLDNLHGVLVQQFPDEVGQQFMLVVAGTHGEGTDIHLVDALAEA